MVDDKDYAFKRPPTRQEVSDKFDDAMKSVFGDAHYSTEKAKIGARMRKDTLKTNDPKLKNLFRK